MGVRGVLYKGRKRSHCVSFRFVLFFNIDSILHPRRSLLRGRSACPSHAELVKNSIRLQAAFAQLNTKEMYLGIASEDASIVYYKISQGIVKPPV